MPTASFATCRAAVMYWLEERGRHAQAPPRCCRSLRPGCPAAERPFAFTSTPTQRLHRRGVLGAVQALDRHIARLRVLCALRVECVLHPGRRTNRHPSAAAADCRAAASNVRAACAAPSPRSPRSAPASGGPGRPTRVPPVFSARVVAGEAVFRKHRAMLIRLGRGGSLCLCLERHRGGDQKQKNTQTQETLDARPDSQREIAHDAPIFTQKPKDQNFVVFA